MVQDEMLASGRLAIDATLVLVISVSTVFGLQAQDLLVALLLSVHPRSRGLFFCALHGSTGRETGRLIGLGWRFPYWTVRLGESTSKAPFCIAPVTARPTRLPLWHLTSFSLPFSLFAKWGLVLRIDIPPGQDTSQLPPSRCGRLGLRPSPHIRFPPQMRLVLSAFFGIHSGSW